ncbi:MAG: hypothetical protein ACOCR1_00220 [Planctomycetota bacterium]
MNSSKYSGQSYHRSIALKLLPLGMGLMILLMAGCATHPRPEHTYDYVERYDRMSEELDPILSLVYFPEDASLLHYDNVIIGNMTVGENWIEDEELAQRYATYMRIVLAQALEKEDAFERVTLDPTEDFEGPTMRIEGMYTLFDPGSGTARFFSFFVPFLQKSGATDLQLEARIYDIESGNLLMELVDRRRHLGHTPWLPNVGAFSDQFVMKHTVWETAHSIAAVLQQTAEGLSESEIEVSQEESQ